MGFTSAIFGIGLFFGQTQVQEISKEDIKKGKAFYNAGVRHLSKKRYTKAVEAFENSYNLTHAPALLYNIGLAHKGSGNETAAMMSFSKFLPHADGAQRKQIGDNIVEICNRAGEYQFCMGLIDERYSKRPSVEQAKTMAAVCDRNPKQKACISRINMVYEATNDKAYLLTLSKLHEESQNWNLAITNLSKYLELTPKSEDVTTHQSRMKLLIKKQKFSERLSQTLPNNKTPPKNVSEQDTKTVLLASVAALGFTTVLGSHFYMRLNCSNQICSEKSRTPYNVSMVSAVITDIAIAWLAYHLWEKSRSGHKSTLLEED